MNINDGLDSKTVDTITVEATIKNIREDFKKTLKSHLSDGQLVYLISVV